MQNFSLKIGGKSLKIVIITFTQDSFQKESLIRFFSHLQHVGIRLQILLNKILKQLVSFRFFEDFITEAKYLLFTRLQRRTQDIEGVRSEDLPRHTINTLQVYGQDKYLVLQV
jgi:hypothetical protein